MMPLYQPLCNYQNINLYLSSCISLSLPFYPCSLLCQTHSAYLTVYVYLLLFLYLPVSFTYISVFYSLSNSVCPSTCILLILSIFLFLYLPFYVSYSSSNSTYLFAPPLPTRSLSNDSPVLKTTLLISCLGKVRCCYLAQLITEVSFHESAEVAIVEVKG